MKINLPVTDQERVIPDDANILSTTNLKGAITHVNDDFIEISGFEREELIGKNHNIVRHPDMPPEAFADLWQTIKSGRSWMGIVKNRCKNGDYYWVKAYVTPIYKDGEICEYQSVRTKPSEDEVRRAEKLYARLRAGKTPRWLKRPAMAFRHKLIITFLLLQVTTLALPLASGALSPLQALLSLLPGLFIAAAFLYREMRPLCRSFARAREIFHNPLAAHVFAGRVDEPGQLAMAMKYLETETVGIVGRVSDFSHQVAQEADRLQEIIEMNRLSIDTQYQETGHAAEAMDLLVHNIQQVADNAQVAAENTVRAKGETAHSKQVVQETLEAVHLLAADVKQAGEVVQELGQDSKQISTVVDVIGEIAEKTNLLALNAAIEAARAGEQGRGFAVVADEVRSLAIRTQDSTQQIQQMIERLQSTTARVVDVMDKSLEKTDHSVALGKAAVASLDVIGQSVATISEMTAQISTAVDEQNAATQESRQSLVNIQQSSEVSLYGIQQSQQTSEAMTSQARNMGELTRQFWLKRR